MRRLGAVLVLLGSAAVVLADDWGPAEKKWVATCVENLASKSAVVRGSAEKAISGLGQGALPAVVAATTKLKTDDDWRALSRAIAGMGTGVRKSVDDLRTSWPKGTEKRFADLLGFLATAEAEAKKNGSIPLPSSPADVASRVKAILDGYREQRTLTPDDQAIRDLIALGHPAVGALLEFLGTQNDQSHHSGEYAAQMALPSLVDASDTPVLCAMLRKGRTTVARALQKSDAPDVLDAFVDAIGSGFVDHDLLQGLDTRGGEPRIHKALIAWLEMRRPTVRPWDIGGVAQFLERNRVQDAVPALRPYLDLADLQPRQFVALALANLGEKEGIPVLIEVLTMPENQGPTGFDYPRHCAGNALNQIAGKTIYTGKEIQGAGGPMAGPARYDADWAATAKTYRAWWAANKDKARFDAATRSWTFE